MTIGVTKCPIVSELYSGIGETTQVNWRQVNAIIGSGFDAMGWVPEGQRSGQMAYSTSNKSATYVTLGEEDAATFEAISAGREFEDIQARMTFRLLQKTMLKEEMAILAGNASLQLGAPLAPSLSASGSGGTLPATTYYVKVVGLTLEGYQNSSVLGGVATSMAVNGADGKTYTLSGGSSNISPESSQTTTSGQTLFMSVAAMQGAVAYAWYVSTASGTETLQAITTDDRNPPPGPYRCCARPPRSRLVDDHQRILQQGALDRRRQAVRQSP